MKRLSPAAPTAAMSGGIALLAFLTVLLVTSLVRSNGGVAAAVARGSDPSAPTFALEPLNQSQKVDLDVYAGRVIVINFWASWCGPCRAEAPTFENLWQRWRTHLVSFVGVDVRDGAGAARAFVAKKHLTYPIGHDDSQETVTLYGVGILPATFIVSPSGHVVAHFLGFVSESDLDGAIAHALRAAGAA